MEIVSTLSEECEQCPLFNPAVRHVSVTYADHNVAHRCVKVFCADEERCNHLKRHLSKKKLEENPELLYAIVDVFENLLNEKDIDIPCADSYEEEWRRNDDSSARLYGTEYYTVENMIKAILEK